MQDTKIKSYKDLIVWQKSYTLTKIVYEVSLGLPQSEVYALQSQIRRCAVSIPSNIAEGYNRNTKTDYKHFLHIAFGSAAELETQLLLCKDIYKLDITMADKLLDEVSRMLRAMISKLDLNPRR